MTLEPIIRVGTEDFDVAEEVSRVTGDSDSVGAVCSFIGLVRDFSERPDVRGMVLEHYPGMTEKSLHKIAESAAGRWSLQGLTIIHRVGELRLRDQIVLVVTASAHRQDAFAACEFVMDYLKVEAPFWKKELTEGGAEWVDARVSDEERAAQHGLHPGV